MNGSGLTMVARVAVLVLAAAGLAGCVVETVEEPDGEAAQGLVGGGDDAELASDVDDEGAPEVDDEAGGDFELPALFSSSTKSEEVTGDPFPDPWDIGEPETDDDPDSEHNSSMKEY